MPAPHLYDYAVVRVVPRADRGEFVNAGVVLSCPSMRFLEARIDLDERRLLALCPGIDVALVRDYLAAIPLLCAGGPQAGPIGRLTQRERFHWVTATRSTIIQCSPMHTGHCTDPGDTLECLLDAMVRCPSIDPPAG